MTTLAYGAITITLSDDLLWSDEYEWTAVEQQRSYSLSGALIVDVGVKAAGRPITLAGDDDYGWITRDVLDDLRTAADLPGQEFTLTLRGVAHTVIFDADPISARPVLDMRDPDDADHYIATLKFLEV